jgi:hypothetical protein
MAAGCDNKCAIKRKALVECLQLSCAIYFGRGEFMSVNTSMRTVYYYCLALDW